jgi:acetyltransferase-like isoleucine patch superfamily enzyme
LTVKIGKFCAVADDVQFGNNVTLHGFANLYGCVIGDECSVGPFVEIQSGVSIGNRVRIQSHTFICSDIVIEDDVFIGHNVSFINDRYPSVPRAREGSWKPEGSRIGRGASVGTGAVILCGIHVGEGAVIGAGGVVTNDIPPHTVVAGVPAKIIRTLDPEEQWMNLQPPKQP